MIRSYYGVLYSYYIVPFGTPTMEYFPKELDYKSANFGAMCKRPPNPFERHLNEDGFRGDHIMWERRIAPGKAKDGAKDQIPSRGGWFASGEFSH